MPWGNPRQDRIRLTGSPRISFASIGAIKRLTQVSAWLERRFKNSTRPLSWCARFRRHIMAKPTTIKIRLNSTAGTGHFYVTKKNARTMTEKMVVRKYDPVVRKHVEYKEGKIK